MMSVNDDTHTLFFFLNKTRLNSTKLKRNKTENAWVNKKISPCYKEVSSTIFWVFGMIRPGIEPSVSQDTGEYSTH